MMRIIRLLLLSCGLLAASTAAFAQLSVTIVANTTSGCGSLLTSFTPTVTGATAPIVSYDWQFGDGSSASTEAPGHIYNQNTSLSGGDCFTVTLVITDANGNTAQSVRNNYICVYVKPTVSFAPASGATTTGCAPLSVQFISTSSAAAGNTITNYLWNSGGGNPNQLNGNFPNPTFTYTVTGNYAVTLQVTDNHNCKDILQRTNIVSVTPTPQACFTETGISSCSAPITAVFNPSCTNTFGAPGVTYFWDFGDGTTLNAGTSNATQTHTYSNSGAYNVRLIASGSNGCADTLNKVGLVNIGSVNFSASARGACVGDQICFNYTGNGTNVSISYGQPGDGGSNAPPFCHSYLTPGPRIPCLTVTLPGGCTVTKCLDTAVYVTTPPVPNFVPSAITACAVPATINCNPSVPSAAIASCAWTANGATVPTVLGCGAQSFTFNTAGATNIVLQWTDTVGCVGTKNIPIAITTPKANFTPTKMEGCVPYNTNLVGGSSTWGLPAAVGTYQWFIDNSPTPYATTATAPPYTYAASPPCTHKITLVVTNTAGCVDSLSKTLKGATKPTAAYSAAPTTVCAQFPVTFTDLSPATVCAKKCTYFTGEGFEYTCNPSHIYRDTAVFRPFRTWFIVESQGCKSDTSFANQITVTPTIAAFAVKKTCSNRSRVTLQSSGNVSPDRNCIGCDLYNWQVGAPIGTFSFASGTSSTSPNPVLDFTACGTYTVTLTSTNVANGCTQSATRSFSIMTASPTFTLPAITSGCAPLCLQAFNTTPCQTPANLVSSWFWTLPTGAIFDSNTGSTSGSSSPTFCFPAAGSYSGVKLLMTDINGCKDSLTNNTPIIVGGSQVNFTANPAVGCVPLTTTFTPNCVSFPPGSTFTGFFWDLGNDQQPFAGVGGYYDHQSATQQNATYTITQGGNYDMKLVVTNSAGCRDSVVVPSLQVNGPTARFNIDTVRCTLQPLTIVNQSFVQGATATYNWNFGAASGIPNNTAQTPTGISFATEGTYSVCMTVTDNVPCSASVCKSVRVVNPRPNFTADTTQTFCPPLPVNLTNTSTGSVRYQWRIFNCVTGVVINNANTTNDAVILTDPGEYTVVLISTSPSGCVDSLVRPCYLKVRGPQGAYAFAPTSGCAPLTVVFTGSSLQGQTQVAWQTDDAATCPGSNPLTVHNNATGTDTYTYTYKCAGTYFPKMRLEDPNGCSRTFDNFIPITVDTSSGWTNRNPAAVCIGDSVTLHAASANPGATFSWSTFNPPVAPFAATADVRVAPTTTTTYYVAITSGNGCVKVDSVIVSIKPFPLPVVTISPLTNEVCEGAFLQLIADGTRGVGGTPISTPSAYVWDPLGLGLSCYTGCLNPIATPLADATYTVTVTDALSGCIATASKTLVVIRDTINLLMPNPTICRGGGVQLDIIYPGTSPAWSPSIGLSCISCPAPFATPVSDQDYILQLTVANGCRARDTITVHVLDPDSIKAGPDKAVCLGFPVNLSGSVPPGGGLVWTVITPATGGLPTPDNVLSPSVNVTGIANYVLTYTNDRCITTDTVQVEPRSKADVAGVGGTICSGDTIQLNASGFSNFFTWSPAGSLNNAAAQNPLAFPRQTTTYLVIGSLGGNCETDSANVTVTVNALPSLTVSPLNGSYFPNQAVNILLNTTAVSPSILWTGTFPLGNTINLTCTDCDRPVFRASDERHSYHVVVTDGNGCVSEKDINLRLRTECSDDQIFVPNAFSPNGDGNNDVLYVRGSAVNKITVFRVFDRWGTLMFETTDINKGWDGSFQGKKVNPDVYVYYVEAPCVLDQQPVFQKGNVTVVK